MTEEDNTIPTPQGRGSGNAAMKTDFSVSSWSEAHGQYCQQHGVLRASIRSVVNELSQAAEYDLPWELPTTSQVVTTIDGLINPSFQSSQLETKVAPWQRTKQLASSLVSSFFQDNIEEAIWQESEDNAVAMEASTVGSSSLDWDAPIIDVQLTKSCLRMVERAIQQHQGHVSAFWIMTKSEWKGWCCSHKTEEVLARLSSEDADWLLDVLVENNQAKIVKRDQLADLVVLSHALPESSSDNDTALDVAIALHDVKVVQQKLEDQIEAWATMVHDCQKKALHHKRQHQTSLAVMQMKKSKLLQQRIDSSTQALLQLEQAQATIEMTQNNQTILKVLAQSSEQLRKLTQQTPIEEVESIKDALQLETEKAMEIQEVLTASNMSIEGSDEDALWKELEGLVLADSEPAAQPAASRDNKSFQKVKIPVPTREIHKEKKAESVKSPVLL